MQKQINISSITQFAQQLKSAELSQQKEIKIPIQQARLLNITLVELMDKVNRDWESLYHELKKSANPDVIKVELDGGGFDKT